MRELVDHILFVADENKIRITQLQLHKVSYFAFGFLISNNKALAEKYYKNNEKFEAWMYGPVLPDTFRRFSMFKSTPILEKGKKSVILSKQQGFNEFILKLLYVDPYMLVKKSRGHASWIKKRKEVLNNKRPKYDIRELERDFSHNDQKESEFIRI